MSNFSATVLTLFPEMFPGPLAHSIAGSALKDGKWQLRTIQIRDFGIGKHQQVDDSPYGGGAGMVMKPDVVDAAITHAKTALPDATLVYLTPKGAPLTQKIARRLSSKPLILLCGRYEAVDQRVIDKHQPIEISLGDYVLSGGELAAMVVLDACVRLIPGVMGDETSLEEESFSIGEDSALLLEYPHYTKPPIWEGQAIPDVLLSGHHAEIAKWRRRQAEAETKARRPDLWERYERERTNKG